MRKHDLAMMVSASILALTGCDAVGGSSADTTMKNVEILPGTASDEMITLDAASGDGTAVDTSAAVGPVIPGVADDKDDDADAPDGDSPAPPGDDADPPEAGGGDVVIRPPASGAEPDAPAKK